MLCPQLAHTCTADPESRMATSIFQRSAIRQNPVGMLDDPDIVASEYADARRLQARMGIYSRAADAAFDAVVETAPAKVLDVGAGTGELAIPGIEAVLADACALPPPDRSFDCVVANWMLYHVADREQAIAELARVLRPGGRLVAATFSERNLDELWEALGDDTPRGHGFTAENGAAQLQRRFANVEARRIEWPIEFSDRDALQAIVAATIRRSHLAARVPHLPMPFEATARHAVFVAAA
jgi:SAM-dependent methyltransferase